MSLGSAPLTGRAAELHAAATARARQVLAELTPERLGRVTRRQRTFLERRAAGATLQEIAAEIGGSRQNAHAIERRILERLSALRSSP